MKLSVILFYINAWTATCVFSPVTLAAPIPLVIAADAWCPYNCEATSHDRGFMIDAASEILGKYGYEVIYRNSPWTNAIRDVANGHVDAVVGAGSAEAKDLVTAFEPLGINKTCFFTASERNFRYTGVTSLNAVRLGVIAGYLYGELIDRYIEEHRIHYNRVQLVTGDKPLLQNVKKLQAGRIDALAENEMVMSFSTRKFNINGLRNAGCEKETALYIAFSPKRSDAKRLAELMNGGMPELRRSGKFKAILKRYGVNDWK